MRETPTSVKITQILEGQRDIEEKIEKIHEYILKETESKARIESKVLNIEKRMEGLEKIIYGTMVAAVLALVGFLGQIALVLLGRIK